MPGPSLEPRANRFLAALPMVAFERLAPHLEPVTKSRATVLHHIGETVAHVYFPVRGLVSLVKVMNDGGMAEVGTIGREGAVGFGPMAVGMAEVIFETTAAIELDAYRLPVKTLHAAMEGHQAIGELARRYGFYASTCFAQMVACYALHTLMQRCCRWLLMALDSIQEQTLGVTHEYLALMMAVHRPALSYTLGALQRQGVIEIGRASITVLDRTALERHACECYATLRAAADNIYRS